MNFLGNFKKVKINNLFSYSAFKLNAFTNSHFTCKLFRLLQNANSIGDICKSVFRNDVKREGFFSHFERKTLNLFSFSSIKLSAFTLAEVLIVLGIIGIIAELTIPDLVNNVQHQELKVALKKTYSSLSQAFLTITADNGGSFIGLCADKDDVCVKNLFESKMQVAKDCTKDSDLGVCQAATARYLNPSLTTNANTKDESFLLNDGTSIAIWPDDSINSNCNDSTGRVIMNGTNAGCAELSVDVNGLKPPNKQGEDIYYFHVLSDRILPFGGTYSHANYQYCAPNEGLNTTESGSGCAFVVLNGGWHK